MIELTYEQWEEQYGPFKAYDTYDERLKDIDPHYAWTFRSGDDQDVITNGFGWVNRLEYYVTAKPWKEDEDIIVTW